LEEHGPSLAATSIQKIKKFSPHGSTRWFQIKTNLLVPKLNKYCHPVLCKIKKNPTNWLC
jgi:hypothetical protein